MSETIPTADGTTSTGGDGPRSRSRRAVGRNAEQSGGRDRSTGLLAWYRIVQYLTGTLAMVRLPMAGHRTYTTCPRAGACCWFPTI